MDSSYTADEISRNESTTGDKVAAKHQLKLEVTLLWYFWSDYCFSPVRYVHNYFFNISNTSNSDDTVRTA